MINTVLCALQYLVPVLISFRVYGFTLNKCGYIYFVVSLLLYIACVFAFASLCYVQLLVGSFSHYVLGVW